MMCHKFLAAIDPYLDDELSVRDVLRLHGHVLRCERCRRVMGSEADLHALLADDAARIQPPESLRERVLHRVAAEAGGDASVAPSEARADPGPLASLSAVVAATLLVVLLLLVPLMPAQRELTELAPIAAELAAKHLLYSGEASALELRTSEAARMTAWLEPRVGLSLNLPRLDAPNDRLLGGRVSSLADIPAAYLLYERGGRRISLFVVGPVPGTRGGALEKVVDGAELYTMNLLGVVLAWWEHEDEGHLYAAASTGDPAELEAFALLCVRTRRR